MSRCQFLSSFVLAVSDQRYDLLTGPQVQTVLYVHMIHTEEKITMRTTDRLTFDIIFLTVTVLSWEAVTNPMS